MTILKFYPAFNNLSRSSFFNDPVWNEFFKSSEGNFFDSIPSVCISEDNEAFFIELLVPGLTKNDLKIEVDNQLLTIFSDKKRAEDQNRKYLVREFNFSVFKKTINLPDMVDTDKNMQKSIMVF